MSLLLASLSILLVATTSPAAPTLTITNDGAELFQHVVEVPAPPALPASLETSSGLPSPIQSLPNGNCLVLVPGLLAAGDTVTLRPCSPAAADVSDLQVQITDQTLTVRNSFLGITFPRVGNGGLPLAVEYPFSGHIERDFQWMDRLYERGQGQLMLWDDREATASVVEEGPLQITVETRARYLKRGQAPGNNQVTYRWTFRAFSPIVLFSAHVQREDDFNWPELHILQISRKDDRLKRWAGKSADITSGPLRDDNTSRDFSQWGALDDGQHAIALAWDGKPVIMYDGRTSYVYYLQYCEGFAERSRNLTGRLYVGPALTPERYDEELMRRPRISAKWEEPPTTSQPTVTPELLTLRNGTLALGFTTDTLGCASLRDLTTGHDFLGQRAAPTTWRLVFQDANRKQVTVDSTAPCHRTHQLSSTGQQLTLRWSNLTVGDETEALDVVVDITLAPDADRSHWRIQVDNRCARHSLLHVQFPAFAGFCQSARPQVAVPRSNWGRLHENFPALGGTYPSCDWPMQFLSVHEEGAGLYLAYEDPQAFPKSFRFQPQEVFHFDVLAEDATRPGNDFTSPGAVAIGVCGPSWWRACKMYRRWALTAPWTREGPLVTRESTPDFCKQLGLWFCDGADAQTVITNMRQAAHFFGVPVGMHWYGWHRWPFDTHYPDYFPAIPDFKIAIDALVPEGKVIMPYINGRIVDKTVEAFAEFLPWTAKDMEGNSYTEVYGNGVQQAPMCPATSFWQQRIPEICERLIGEYGVNGIYIDQIGAAGAAPCYDASHGHPLGGGSHWVDGYRILLQKVQEACHRNGRDVLITTENNTESYMDGVDCFLIWNPRLPDEIPMMTAVYSGYTLYFASNARCEAGLQPYAMIEGRDFIWGSQLGWMGFEDAAPTERGNYLRQLVRLRHAALKYVVFGELLGELKPLEAQTSQPAYVEAMREGKSLTPRNTVGTVTGKWHDWTGKPFDATLPAVMATVWKGSDGTLGLIFANLTSSSQAFDYELDPAAFGGVAGEGQALLLTDINPDGSIPCGFSSGPILRRTELLQPWQARVLEVKHVPGPEAAQTPPGLQDTDQARAFRLEAWAGQQGLAWQIGLPPTQVAAGDTVAGAVRIKPGPQRPSVYVDYGGERRTYAELTPDPAEPQWQQCALPVQIPPDMAPGETFSAHIRIRFDEQHELAVPFTVRAVPQVEVSVALQGDQPRAGETCVLRVTLRSNLARRLRAGTRVALTAPESWELWPARQFTFGELPAHSEATRLVRCRIPYDAPTGRIVVKAHVIQAAASTGLELAPPRRQATAAHLTPVLDGDLSEWAQLPPITLGPADARQMKDYSGETDLSARAWLAADDQALYIAADVTDDQHVQNGQHARMWEGDCLQVDFRPGAPPAAATFDRVIELGLALTQAGPEVWQWMPQERVVAEARLVVLRDGVHTRYEAAIPWSALPGLLPPSGRGTSRSHETVAFSMTVNESDSGQFDGWLEWTPGICGGKDASQFGRLRLQPLADDR